MATATAALILLAAGGWLWLGMALWSPIDPQHADMLVVVREGIHRFLHGLDPYTIYHVPWSAPLPYGPVLWGPYAIPTLLHADLRLVTVTGELFAPACCVLASIVEARRGQLASAAAWLVLLASIIFNPGLAAFTPVGHTPSYWPLLPMFAIFVVSEQWYAAAFLLGLLIVGRSTMLSIAPLFAMTVWLRARTQAVAAIVIVIVTVITLILPFALWDPGMLWYDMIASYPEIIKKVVWPDVHGARDTIGLTGWLLAHHLQRFSEVAQVVGLLFVYVGGWRALERGAPLLPWAALALFVFSATSLWPVNYLYFDVLWLLVAAAAAHTLGRVRFGQHVAGWSVMLVTIVALVVLLFHFAASPWPTFDVASAGGRRTLYQGLVISRLDGGEPAALIWGQDATMSIPRSAATAATIVLTAQGVVAADARPQVVSAMVNGISIGTSIADRGWHELRFHAPASVWIAGANTLALHCASSAPPASVGLGEEPRHIALGIRRVQIVGADAGER